MLKGLESYRGKKILVTGHTGFKGAWLSTILSMAGADVFGLSLKPESESLYTRVGKKVSSEEFLDIRDRKLVNAYFQKNKFDGVFHLAAQPLVRLSYLQPIETFDTNLMGTAHLLEGITKNSSANWVVVITTDKVYEYSGNETGLHEGARLGGSDPYSASKVAVEHLLVSWRNVISFMNSELRLVSVRAGNVIGGGDNAVDRLLPDIVRNFKAGQKVIIRNPTFVRPWQHVLDPLNGYLLLGKRLMAGDSVSDSYNFGPTEESKLTVREIADIAAEIWPGNPGVRIHHDETRIHETPFLWLASNHARSELGWQNKFEAREAVRLTLNWEIDSQVNSPTLVLENQIKSYFGERE